MYPIHVKMKGVRCLVVGGGHVAWRKTKTLMEEEAQVTVMAPEFCDELEKANVENRISLCRKSYDIGDVKGYRFVITASGNREVAEQIKKEAEQYGIWFNSADFPDVGNCFLPARCKKEGFMITVSTEGRSPAMAKYMKERLADTIPKGYGIWLDRVTGLRQELKQYMKNAKDRERFWRLVLNKEVMNFVKQGRFNEAEECVRRDFSSFRSKS